jgi:antirestriction protein ArdC
MEQNAMKKARPNIYEDVTNQILQTIHDQPDGKFMMPWHRPAGTASMIPRNATTKNAYRGMNILMLWLSADANKYPSGEWASYKQWEAAGAQVRKGERSTPIIFYKQFEVETEKPDDDGKRFMARTSVVFNAAQVEGYTPAGIAETPNYGAVTLSEDFKRLVAATGAVVHTGGARAFYRTDTDEITMPPMSLFHDTPTQPRDEGYMSTLAHELGHWTGAKHRLDRNLSGNKRFGNHAYAAEEIIAEMTAAFVAAHLGLSNEPRPDHAQYIAHYLKMMRDDSRAIFKAAADAEKATAYLLALREAAPLQCPCGSAHPPSPLLDGARQLLEYVCADCKPTASAKYIPTVFDHQAAA